MPEDILKDSIHNLQITPRVPKLEVYIAVLFHIYSSWAQKSRSLSLNLTLLMWINLSCRKFKFRTSCICILYVARHTDTYVLDQTVVEVTLAVVMDTIQTFTSNICMKTLTLKEESKFTGINVIIDDYYIDTFFLLQLVREGFLLIQTNVLPVLHAPSSCLLWHHKLA